MRVCFIAGTLGRGGAEKQLLYMLKALKEHGIDVRVMCLTHEESYEKTINEIGIDVEWVGRSKSRLLRVLRIIKSLQQTPADIIQSAHFYTNLYAGICGRILKMKSIGAVRNDLNSEISAHGSLGKWQLKAPEFLITNSKMARNLAIEKGVSPQNIECVQNVIEIDESSGRMEEGISSDIRIIFVGRLVEQKRPGLFISLAAALVARFPEMPLRFEMIGDGPLRADLERFASRSGLERETFVFRGELDDLSSPYTTSSIMVLTSAFEGVPNALLEAMSYSVPVVATNVGGVSEIVPDGCGILVDPDDTEGLIEAVSQLILNPKLRRDLGKAGLAFVRSDHAVETLGGKLKAIYSTLTTK